MSHNFKRGIDHLAIPKTDNANTYFVDGGCFNNVGGSDITGDGSSSNPWATLTHAQTNTSSGDIIVIAKGEYINQVDSFSDRYYLGDDLNGDVIIKDNTGTLTAFTGQNTSIENLNIQGYNKAITNGVGRFDFGEFCLNCMFVDVLSGIDLGGNSKLDNCIMINSDLLFLNNSFVNNCACYNSDIINNSGASSVQSVISRCYFDEDCKYIRSTGLGTVRLGFSFNGTTISGASSHIYDLSTFDNGDATNLNIDPTVLDEQGSPSLFNSPSYIDLSTQVDSPLLFGDQLGNIGNVFFGLSQTPDQPDFVTKVMANPDIEIDNEELDLVDSVPIGESRYIEGFSVTSSNLSVLSIARQVGVGIRCNYEWQVRVVGKGFDISTGVWKTYVLGERMTQNSDGTPTGESTYDWGDNQLVKYAIAEGRLKLTKV